MTETAPITDPTPEELEAERAETVAEAAAAAAQAAENRARLAAMYADRPEVGARVLANHDALTASTQRAFAGAIECFDIVKKLDTP